MEETPTMIPTIMNKVGVIEGRLVSMEGRMDRHENFVGTQLSNMVASIKDIGREFRESNETLQAKVDKIEGSLDREEGARNQSIKDKKAVDDDQQKIFNQSNIKLAGWLVVLTAVSVLVGAIGQSHLHIIMAQH